MKILLPILILLFLIPINSNADCDFTYNVSQTFIIISDLPANSNAKLFDNSNTIVWECNPWNGAPCFGNHFISDLAANTYFLSVQSSDCSEWIPLVVTGLPDLAITNKSGLPTELNPGSTFIANLDISNIGDSDVEEAYIVRFYLTDSNEPNLFNEEIIGETIIQSTPPGATINIQEQLQIPENLFLESYDLLISVDPDRDILEIGEYIFPSNNNNRVGPLINNGYLPKIKVDWCNDQQVVGSYTTTEGTLDWYLPLAESNCTETVQNIVYTQISGPEKGSIQPVGTYEIVGKFEDACGATAYCTINVTIDGMQPTCLEEIATGTIDCSEYLPNGNYRVVIKDFNNNLTEYIYGTDGDLVSSQELGSLITQNYAIVDGNIVIDNGQGNVAIQEPGFDNLIQTYTKVSDVIETATGYIFGTVDIVEGAELSYSIHLVETDFTGSILNESIVATGENFEYTTAFVKDILHLEDDKYAVFYTYPTGNAPYGYYKGEYAVFDQNLQILHTDYTNTLNYNTVGANPGLRKTSCGNFFMRTGTYTTAAAGPQNTVSNVTSSYLTFDGTKLVPEKQYTEYNRNYWQQQTTTRGIGRKRFIDYETPNGDQLVVNHEYEIFYNANAWVYAGVSPDPNDDIIYLEHYAEGELVWSAELPRANNYEFEEFVLIGDKHYFLGTLDGITYLVDLDCHLEITPPEITCDINITSTNGSVAITGLPTDANTKLFDASYTAVFECNPWNGNTCAINETVTGLTTGATYYLSVQSDLCDEWIPIVINNNGGCTDSDNDGFCDEDDCQPNNPALPTTPGTTCNDFNMMTDNDIIQADGCTCAGTPSGEACNINVTQSNGTLTITGLTGAENAKLFDETVTSSGIVWQCNPWNTSPCSDNEVVSGLPAGQYFLSVQSDNCDEWIAVTLDGNQGDELIFECPEDLNFLFIPTDVSGPCLNVSIIDYPEATTTCAAGGIEVILLSSSGELMVSEVENGFCGPILLAGTGTSQLNFQATDACGNVTTCSYFVTRTLDPNAPVDQDGDGLNSNEDCNDNNISLPGNPGDPCFNNDDSLPLDGIVSADGCTCDVGPVACNVSVNSSNGTVTIEGLTGLENSKLFDSNIAAVWECNPWNGNPCSGTETISGLNAGETYFLSVQSDVCDEWIPITIENSAITQPISRNAVTTSNEFVITNFFPNPASAEAFLKVESSFDGRFVLEIYDIIGTLKSSKNIEVENGNNTIQLDINSLTAGTYQVILRNKNNEMEQIRFVKF